MNQNCKKIWNRRGFPGHQWSILKFKHRLYSAGVFSQSALPEGLAVLHVFSSSVHCLRSLNSDCLDCGMQEKDSLYFEVGL